MSMLLSASLRRVTIFSTFLWLAGSALSFGAADGQSTLASSEKSMPAQTVESSRRSSPPLLGSKTQSAATRRHLDESMRRKTLTFVPNLGQVSQPTRFLAVGDGFAISLEQSGLTFRTGVPARDSSRGESSNRTLGAGQAGRMDRQ